MNQILSIFRIFSLFLRDFYEEGNSLFRSFGTGLLTGDEPLEAIVNKDFRLLAENWLEPLQDEPFRCLSPL